MNPMIRASTLVLLLVGLIGIGVVWLSSRGEPGWTDAQLTAEPPAAESGRSVTAAEQALIDRGRYLALLGNCQGCHTARGGEPFAGGRPIATPFGTVYGSNLTPDAEHGLGRWSADAFWRALHHGRSRDGRLLSPAFPYPNFTQIERRDADALYQYLRSLPAVALPNRPHDLRWPFGTQAAQAVWRAMYFRADATVASEPGKAGAALVPADVPADASAIAPADPIARGRYLVQALGHCSACHAPRDRLGGLRNWQSLGGGLMPMHNWYAPSLLDPQEAGVQRWAEADIVRLLQAGRSERQHAVASGPMAEVVLSSTQFWRDDDLRAAAAYLRSLPVRVDDSYADPTTPKRRQASAQRLARGAQLYDQHCADCHGGQGEGTTGALQGIYPPLVGNRTVTMASPANLVKIVRDGGFGAATAAHPRPFGMPPFVVTLDEAQMADLLTFLRQSWGHQAQALDEVDVGRFAVSAQD